MMNRLVDFCKTNLCLARDAVRKKKNLCPVEILDVNFVFFSPSYSKVAINLFFLHFQVRMAFADEVDKRTRVIKPSNSKRNSTRITTSRGGGESKWRMRYASPRDRLKYGSRIDG